MPDKTDKITEDIKNALLTERDEIMAMSAAHAAEGQPVPLDQTSVGRLSRMDAMQVQEMARQVNARRQARLRAIKAALQRVDEREYGYCLSCGRKIAAKRLAVDLITTRCIKCAG